MSCASSSAQSIVSIWVDEVAASPQEFTTAPPIIAWEDVDKENPRPVKKRSRANSKMDDDEFQETPRPLKRARTFDEPNYSPAESPTKSESVDSRLSELESHKSGRLSPVKQMQYLHQANVNPIFWRDFGDHEDGQEQDDVIAMRTAIEQFAEGYGIIAFDDEVDEFLEREGPFEFSDEIQFRNPAVNRPAFRRQYGGMPRFNDVRALVNAARELNRDTCGCEDEWNTDVQLELIRLSLETLKHRSKLEIKNVIEPAWLSPYGVPKRVFDYVVTLVPDAEIKEQFRALKPVPGTIIRSWNHTIQRLNEHPIAVNIETKSPLKSWTDGKPQIAIWTSAWFKRLWLLWKRKWELAKKESPEFQIPAVPILVAQGHEWHLLIFKKEPGRTMVRGDIFIGSTKNCYQTMKVIAALHWVMDWAETVWRPFFKTLILPDEVLQEIDGNG